MFFDRLVYNTAMNLSFDEPLESERRQTDLFVGNKPIFGQDPDLFKIHDLVEQIGYHPTLDLSEGLFKKVKSYINK